MEAPATYTPEQVRALLTWIDNNVDTYSYSRGLKQPYWNVPVSTLTDKQVQERFAFLGEHVEELWLRDSTSFQPSTTQSIAQFVFHKLYVEGIALVPERVISGCTPTQAKRVIGWLEANVTKYRTVPDVPWPLRGLSAMKLTAKQAHEKLSWMEQNVIEMTFADESTFHLGEAGTAIGDYVLNAISAGYFPAVRPSSEPRL